jgi:predicted Rossmann fold nucleotide-binding protein DprA/Smf involved in DNA uptake
MYKNNVNLSVIGSRSFNDYDLLSKTLTDLISEYNLNIVKFVSGGAKGADILGEKWADNNNIEKLIFLPDWKKGRFHQK